MRTILNSDEKRHLECGGELWNIRPVNQQWELIAMKWEGETSLATHQVSKEQALLLLSVLLDLAPATRDVALHHSIKRPYGSGPRPALIKR